MRTLTCGAKSGAGSLRLPIQAFSKGDHQPETATIEWPLQGEKPGDLPPFGLGRRRPEYQEAIWMFGSLSWVYYCVPSQLTLC